MSSFLTVSKVTVAALVIIIIAALAGWYIYLRNARTDISRADEGRGAGLADTSFGGGVGSMFENIVSNFTGATSTGQGSTHGRLINVARTPISGMGFVQTPDGVRLQFVEQSIGNILQLPSGGSIQRLTNTLVPNLFETSVMTDGRVILRGVDDTGTIVTNIGSVSATSTEATSLVLKRLPDDIVTITVSPNGDGMFYILRNLNGAVGMRTDGDGENATQVFSSAISGWRASWLPDDRIVLTQKPSDGKGGYSFFIQSDGSITMPVRNIPGLTFLAHPMTNAHLYGSSGSTLALYARGATSSEQTLLPLRTIADKCVWHPTETSIAFCAVPQSAPAPNFLDAWYRGEVHTSDSWWRIDVATANTELLITPTSPVDVIDPVIDGAGEYIAFTNAIDKSPHMLRINE